MAFDSILVGTVANDTTGDTLRAGGIKINANFAKAVEGPATTPVTDNTTVVFDSTSGRLVKQAGAAVAAEAGKFAPTGNITAGNGMYLPAPGELAFSTAGAHRVRIDASGNVGIGTTTPTRLLTVATDAAIHGVRVGRGAGNVDSSTAVGNAALDSNTGSGTFNTAVGRNALQSNTTGATSTGVGWSALGASTTGNNNTAVGHAAMFANTTGGLNVAIGVSALGSNSSGNANVAVGESALVRNTTANDNVALGRFSLSAVATLGNNVAIGTGALRRIAGSSNVGLGINTGLGITRGVATLGAIVGGSGYTDGTYNGVNLTRSSGTAFDVAPTANITVSGGAVTAVTLVTAGNGFQATDTILTAAASTIGGTGSGFTVAVATLTGAASDNNTFLGFQAGANQTQGSGNLAVGSGVNLDSLTGNNQINIGARYFHDRVRLLERSSDPAKPTEGNVVMWMSDGTGLGDDGDVLIGSTAGGVTNYAILFDHSAGTLWP